MDKTELLKILVNNSKVWIKDEKDQDKAMIYVDDFVNELLEAINYTRCSLQLKEKDATLFKFYVEHNYRVENKRYIDEESNEEIGLKQLVEKFNEDYNNL